ncbi:GDSL-type esterase/lipase family protein [bacterium]|nr:GDSL-type esterase/lipase family protein [bacterium]
MNFILLFFYFILIFVLILFLAEVFFRIAYFFKNKRKYNIIDNNIINLLMYDHHPYIPYTYKKNFFIEKQHLRNDDKKKLDKYLYGVKTNSLGFSNGIIGDREISVPKPKNIYRINCLGASTTAQYLHENNKILSYPIALEEELNLNLKKNNKSVEVNNFGIGGWNSADILINFLLNVFDTKPNMIVIYHAYNDLGISLTDNFKSDYSHSKINFAYNFSKLEILKKFINIKFQFYNYCVLSFLGIKYKEPEIHGQTETLKPNINNEFKGFNTYQRNLELIIKICKSSNIEVVISTFVHLKTEEEIINKLEKKYLNGLKYENKIIKELATKYNLTLVDNESLIPKEIDLFTDPIHFSHKGMRAISANFSKKILELLN